MTDFIHYSLWCMVSSKHIWASLLANIPDFIVKHAKPYVRSVSCLLNSVD